MRQKSVLFFLILHLVIVFGSLFPADVEVKASIDANKIGLDDVLIYTVTIKGISDPGMVDLSNLTDFKIVQTSRGIRQEFINGVYSHYVDFTYYLMPQKTGVLTVPAVSYDYQGREYKTQAFQVEVVAGSVKPAQPKTRGRSLFDLDDDFFSSPVERPRPRAQEIDIKLQAVVSRRDVVQGEQVIYRVLLYSRNTIDSINLVSNQSIAGFWQEWYPVPRSIEGEIKTVDGKSYRVFEIRKAALFPTAPGTVTIPSLKFELSLRDDAFSIFSNPRRIYRSTPEIKINVSPLPPGAEGLPVGDFDFEVTANQHEIDINDILTLKLTIKGQGNIKTVDVPTFENCDYFKVYPAKISQNSQFNDAYLSGVVEAEIPVTFKANGLISFPALEFKYYDPAGARVVTKESRPLAVKVTGKKEEQESAATIPRTEIVRKGEDIDFIKEGKIYNQQEKFYKTGLFKILSVIFFALNILYILKIIIFDKMISRSTLLKKKKLLRSTVGKLQKVREYGEISSILENYLKEKAGLGLSEINNYRIENLFEKYSVSSSDIKIFVRIKSESESSRFSPLKKSGKELKQDLKLLVDILKRIDTRIK